MRQITAVLAACLLLASCNAKDLMKPDPEAQAAAEKAYGQLVRGDYDALTAGFPAELRTDQTKRMAAALREVIPTGPGNPGVIVGINKNVTVGGRTQVLTYDYAYAKEKVRFTATLERAKDAAAWTLVGFNIAPATGDAAGFDFGHSAAPPPERTASTAPAGSGSAPDPKSPE